nr:MAG TPA: hypothetical protein [Bacteriophage sp.]
MTRAEIKMQLPAAMEGASAFEVYVFMHRDNRTIGQIKQVWKGKTTEDIRLAMDKALRLGWPYIPADQLPRLPDDGLRYDDGGLGPQSKGRINHGIKHKPSRPEPPIAVQRRVYDMAVAGYTNKQIRAATGRSEERVRKYSDGQLKRGRRWNNNETNV